MNTTTKTIPSAIEALRKAESALALACSYRDITRSKDGDRIQAALEGARDTLTAHDLGAPGRNALADFGAVVLEVLSANWGYEDMHDMLDRLTREATTRRLATIDSHAGSFVPTEIQAVPRDPMLTFANIAVQTLRDTAEWDSDTLQALADTAANLGISLEGNQEEGEYARTCQPPHCIDSMIAISPSSWQEEGE